MEKTYIQLNKVKVPAELLSHIVSRIRRCEQKRETTRARIFASIAFVALLAIVPAFENVAARAATSGFTGYASLLFSDWSAITKIWNVFALSLAETAPLFAIAISATILFVFAWSTAEAIRYSRAAKMSLS